MGIRYNKGEWSELYAFIKLLKEGRIYEADKDANPIKDQYLPIEKIIRNDLDYVTGDVIKIANKDSVLTEISPDYLNENVTELFDTIFEGSPGEGAFEIPDIQPLMSDLKISSVKANSLEKVDLHIQIHDYHTGFSPKVGFSIKSDIGSPPTLLNPGKNTRFRYLINGLSDSDMDKINVIDKTTRKDYIKERLIKLTELSSSINFFEVIDKTYENNLILIDSRLPEIYGNMILQHYLHIDKGVYNCKELIDFVIENNPLNFKNPKKIYPVKFKKLLAASALGMTPGKEWDGTETANGGYIIIKRNGDVLCYHLYNRNSFEEYLYENTMFDRPSATRYDFGYVYKEDGNKYIDLNIQIRFKPIGKD